MTVIILIIVAILVMASVILLYNSLVRDRNLVKEAWSGIDVQLRRRYNLIPNLVETVKGYAKHEESVLAEVVKFRNQSIDAGAVQEQAQAEMGLTKALKSLFALAEAYPDLKANQNFLELQGNLDEIEEQIQLARRYYNGTVRDYNTRVESFPHMIIAKMFNFHPADYFEIEAEAERSVPQVSFS